MRILLLPAALLISGPAVVLDGDTVVVAGVHIRLKGVDAPGEARGVADEAARQESEGEKRYSVTTSTINRLAMIAAVLGAVLWVASDAKWFASIADNVEKVHQETIVSGPALVLRGWNVSVAGTKIRLRGIDVAESGTPWGDMATLGMKSIVGSELTCRLTGDKFDDPKYSDWEIGYCTKPDGTDIAQELVAKGFALACPRTDDRYVQFEAEGEKSEIRKVMGPQPRSSHCAKRS